MLLPVPWFVGFCFTVVSSVSFWFMDTKKRSRLIQPNNMLSSISQVNAHTPKITAEMYERVQKKIKTYPIRMKSIDDSQNQSIFRTYETASEHTRVSGRQRATRAARRRISSSSRSKIKLLNVCRRILICLLSSPFFSPHPPLSLTFFSFSALSSAFALRCSLSAAFATAPTIDRLLCKRRAKKRWKGCGDDSSSWFRQ